MRKRINEQAAASGGLEEGTWLDVEKLAAVEITSEDAAFPIENALMAGKGPGWRATQSGEQTVLLVFDEPLTLRAIRLVFAENHHQRTQEFVLSWSQDEKSFQEIVRQQYNFNPPCTEVEAYPVELQQVKALRLIINPDISGGSATASLSELRLA